MLDATYRGSVSGILTKKKDWQKSDVPADPTTSFFEQIVTEAYMNQDYFISPPPDVYYNEFSEDEKGNWDPNDPGMFENKRDGKWLCGTWDEYIKPKYKQALDQWNKDTGGGGGHPTEFFNFTGGDCWLVWVFCLDKDAHFLLANSAGGRMPRHMQMEAGFEEEIDSSVTDMSEHTSTTKRNRIKNAIDSVQEQQKDLSRVMDMVHSFLQKKEEEASKEKPRTVEECLQAVASYSQMMSNSSVLETMSPASKDAYVTSLKRQQKSILELITSSTDSGTRDDDNNSPSNN
jgi:hypothetical protein